MKASEREANTDNVRSENIYTNNNGERVILQVRRTKARTFYVSLENGVRVQKYAAKRMYEAEALRATIGRIRTQAAIDFANKNGIAPRFSPLPKTKKNYEH